MTQMNQRAISYESVVLIMIYLFKVVGTRCGCSCIRCPTIWPICVDSREGGKLECPEKTPRSTGEINCENSYSHEIYTTPGLVWLFIDTRHNVLTACATRVPQIAKIVYFTAVSSDSRPPNPKFLSAIIVFDI